MLFVQGPVPLVAARFGQFLHPRLVLGCGSHSVELMCPSSNGETPVSPPTIAPSLFRRAASNSSSIWSALDRSFPNSTSAGVLMCWLDHSLMFFHLANLLSHSLLSWTSKKRLTQCGLRALWSEVGVTRQMWHLMCHFLRDTRSQVRVGARLSAPWQDSGIAQGKVLPLAFFFEKKIAHRHLGRRSSWHMECASCPIIVFSNR